MSTVHRFFVEAPLVGGQGAVVALPRGVAHQMDAVLRLLPGDPVVLFDGGGGEWLLKAERGRRIVVEAGEQCGRTVIPPIHEPRALRAALAGRAPSVICWEGGGGGGDALPLRAGLARALGRAAERGGPANEAQ